MVPEIIRRVGWTAAPVGILTTMEPDELGLNGFPRQRVACRILAMNSAAASVAAAELAKEIPEMAFSELMPREEGSVAFLAHEDYCNVLLKASGKNGVFYKHRKSSADEDNELLLLWLPPEYSLEESLQLAKDDSVFGVVQKSSAVEGRFALRFADLTTLENFATTHSIQSNALFGRWKFAGTLVSLGIAGALTFLHSQDWVNPDVLYVTEGHFVFIAEKIGRRDPVYFNHAGFARQIKWKALNSKAKLLAKEYNKNRATASSEFRAPSRSIQQLENRRLFLERSVKVPPKAAAKATGYMNPCFRIPSHSLFNSKMYRVNGHGQTGPQRNAVVLSVAICPRDALPTVIAAVGYTSRACGVLVVQSPDELHLKGYPRSKVKCTYSVCTEGAERRHIQVERFLVQLGFADQVRMSPAGEELVVGITMTKMQAKCSGHRGWQEGSAPAGMLASWLDKVTPSVAYAEIQARMDSAFTFMCHSDFCDTVLRASGTEGIFTKVHQRHSSEPEAGHELLWLDPEISLNDALLVAENAGALGVVEKGNKGRLALRFRSVEDLTTFAKSNKYDFDASLQRWKVTGVPLQAGVQGLSQMLCSLGWKVAEIPLAFGIWDSPLRVAVEAMVVVDLTLVHGHKLNKPFCKKWQRPHQRKFPFSLIPPKAPHEPRKPRSARMMATRGRPPLPSDDWFERASRFHFPYYFACISRTGRNKKMHALHGNHGDEDVVEFSLCNVAGLQKNGRVEYLSSLTSHFLAW
ncbi:unnamed protein product [Durusdinium trenchii]|uniref:Uncharacterized protein n=1 Tax=Durusdinium trenchii TaxID=1381693 RepID=A0ABP0KUT1_9DINO